MKPMIATSPEFKVERAESRDALEEVRTVWDGLLGQNEIQTVDLTFS